MPLWSALSTHPQLLEITDLFADFIVFYFSLRNNYIPFFLKGNLSPPHFGGISQVALFCFNPVALE